LRSDLIFGRREYGKSTLAMHLALASGRSVFVFDPACGFKAWPESTVGNIATLADMLYLPPDERPRIIIYQPDGANLADEFDAMGELLKTKVDYALIVDEAHWVQHPQWAAPCLQEFVRKPNKFDCYLIQTTHAPADTWGKARSLATDWYIFRLSRAADLDAVERECGSEVREEVTKLQGHTYLHFMVDRHVWEISRNEQAWYVDFENLHVSGGVK
jgi:hypothetical protein